MIEIRNLTVIYKPGDIEALKNVNTEIPLNAVVCIIGPNASGKTTLLKSIAGLIEYKGEVFVNGVNTRKMSRELRRILAYVSILDSTSGYLGARVIDLLITSRYPLSNSFYDSKRDVEEVLEAARETGVVNLLNRSLRELSAGELQRIVLAAALVRKPKILLLDEPDSHLDVKWKTWLSRYLKELSKTYSIILSTHDTVFASNTCEYFLVLKNGELLFNGWKHELYKNKSIIEKAYGVEYEIIEVNSSRVIIPVYTTQNREDK